MKREKKKRALDSKQRDDFSSPRIKKKGHFLIMKKKKLEGGDRNLFHTQKKKKTHITHLKKKNKFSSFNNRKRKEIFGLKPPTSTFAKERRKKETKE